MTNKILVRRVLVLAIFSTLTLAVWLAEPSALHLATQAEAAEMSQDEFERRVHDYLLAHPEVVGEALYRLQEKEDEEAAAGQAVLKAHAAEGNATRGQRVFGTCAACHSLQPDQNMTGPSLAVLWNRKAGSLASFSRYSPALKSANIVWDDKTLDDWIADPQHLVPGNEMTFAGIKDARQRADLLAFLKQATQPGASVAQDGGGMGGMGGMMGGGRVPNLKHLEPENRVQAITYCKDTYTVTTANGQTRKFWERNLRLKTDASADGPEKNAAALVRAGMSGDRADVIFADPSEITSFIVNRC